MCVPLALTCFISLFLHSNTHVHTIAPSLLAILGKQNGSAGAGGLGGLLGSILGGSTQSQSTGGFGGLGSILGGLGSLFGKK